MASGGASITPALPEDSQGLTIPGVFVISSAKTQRGADGGVCIGSGVLFFRLRSGPFEGPANGKPPALPEVSDLMRANDLCTGSGRLDLTGGQHGSR